MPEIDGRKARACMEFGQLLSAFRHDRSLSQEDLASRSGMSVRAIRDLERGQVQRPRHSTVALLADALALDESERVAFKDAAIGSARGAGRGGKYLARWGIVPCQLPPDLEDFTGHEIALQQLRLRAAGRENTATAAMITAVVGKGGIGKSALAVHAAHQLRSHFPGGQLYANLRGVEGQAIDAADVLRRFLSALGIECDRVPGDVDSRVGLYRSLMADRRAIVVLDNAVSEAQVRPLLPAGARNFVLVTSRARLAGLALADVVDLSVLRPGQAVELLGRIVGADRVAEEPEAAATIARLCGYLPLALRIVGVRLAAKPHWRLRRLASRLQAHDRRLDELTAGDLEVRASVALSYKGLGDLERRAFRLLGLLEGPDFAPSMLSALLDLPITTAEDVAEHLADAQLLDTIGEDAAGQLRYRCHDLLRLFAREKLTADETQSACGAALELTPPCHFTQEHGESRELCLAP